jgi:hypothetical protein
VAEVAIARTEASAGDVAGAIVAVYRELRGADPPARSSWLWPLALSANETDSWRQLYNWNAGDVTAWDRNRPWFSNPHVTDAAIKFASFESLRDGVRAMLRTLDRFGGLAAADAGDREAWQHALNAYLGSGTPYPPLWGRIAALESTIPRAARSRAGVGLAVAIGVGLSVVAVARNRRRRALSLRT